ncbi:hypothetical protein ACLMJK_008586 [Lecanora helva]
MPRRSSYASVAAGTASQAPQLPQIQSTSSHLPRIMSTSSHPQPQSSDQSSRIPQTNPDPANQGEQNTSIPASWGRGREMSTFSNQTHRSGYATGGLESPSFLKPSYLRNSAYMETLEEEHKARLAAHQADIATRSTNQGSLSTSSSNASLHKMAPSHRGMTYEIIEHPPRNEIHYSASLPSRWLETDRHGGLEVAADGLEVKYVGLHRLGEHEAAATRSDHPMPPQCGIYYFEVYIDSKGKDGMIGIGFSGASASLERLPGWEPDSWAYHGDDGKSFCCQSQGKNYGPMFTSGDIIGCGVNFMTGNGFFTKNGVFLGNAFKDLKDIKAYPSIGMKRHSAQLHVNFGQRPFVYDIDGMYARERQSIQDEISKGEALVLHPTLNKDDLCRALVAQYLSHDGYVETAKAFAGEVRAESIALKGTPEPRLEEFLSMEEDHDATNRQRIRTAILDGDIDKALKHTNAFYPQVLQGNPQIYFKLRCRKFVEMMRQSTDFLESPVEQKIKSLNGHAPAVSEDGFGPDMDLDEPMKDGDDWDKMDTEEADNLKADAGVRYQMLLTQLIQYGQELKAEFKEDQSELVTKTFTDMFSMLAYQDPRKSPHGKMLDVDQRVPVAEGLNSAILVSLGKSSSTALERLYRGTSVLQELISEEGGPAAFINVRNILKASRSWRPAPESLGAIPMPMDIKR